MWVGRGRSVKANVHVLGDEPKWLVSTTIGAGPDRTSRNDTHMKVYAPITQHLSLELFVGMHQGLLISVHIWARVVSKDICAHGRHWFVYSPPV